MNGRQTAPAVVVRPVRRGESIKDLINEAKARTWEDEAEHMVLRLATRERLMAKGGRDGIVFLVEGEGEHRTLHMTYEGQKVQVVRIYGHTHPRVTGPSDGDLEALRILRHNRSYLFEIGGDPHGTRIRPESSPRPEA